MAIPLSLTCLSLKQCFMEKKVKKKPKILSAIFVSFSAPIMRRTQCTQVDFFCIELLQKANSHLRHWAALQNEAWLPHVPSVPKSSHAIFYKNQMCFGPSFIFCWSPTVGNGWQQSPLAIHILQVSAQSSICKGVNRETTKHRHLACASSLFVCLVQNLWHQQCFERGLAGRYFSLYVYGQLTCQIFSLRCCRASDMSTSSTQCIFSSAKHVALWHQWVNKCGRFHLSEYEEALQVPYTCDAAMVCDYASVMLDSLPLGVSTLPLRPWHYLTVQLMRTLSLVTCSLSNVCPF